MLQNTKRKDGFTIIEVLIVLAIAGLIMLIVFLAVPALQRSSRNTQAKNAASAVLSSVSEYQSVNNGQLPTNVAITAAGQIDVTGAGSATSGKTQAGYTASVGTAMPGATGAYVVYLNRKCNGNAFAATATPRAIAVGYLIETQGGTAAQCTES